MAPGMNMVGGGQEESGINAHEASVIFLNKFPDRYNT